MQSTLPWHIGCIDAHLAPIDRLLMRLECAVAGDTLRTLASVSGCLESFWASVSRSFETNHIQHAAAQLRRSTDMIPQPGTDHMLWLSSNGYCREDIRQIRYVVEAFHGLEPVFAILASLASRWLSQAYFDTPIGNICSLCHSQTIPPSYLGAIEFLNDSDDLSCVDHLAARHGKPVAAFFKALAVWPGYAYMASMDVTAIECFAETAWNIRLEAEDLASRIPMKPSQHPPWIDADAMRRSMTRCSVISSEVIAVTASLRNGFTLGEENERERRGARGGGGRAR
ncbi:MAG: hypothetical protein ACYC64_15330 [Armatimonadota bacterium]